MKPLQTTVEIRLSIIFYAILVTASFAFFVIANSHRHPFMGFYMTEESSLYASWAYWLFASSFALSFFIVPKPRWALNIFFKLLVYISWFGIVCLANFFIYVAVMRASMKACSILRCGLDWGTSLP